MNPSIGNSDPTGKCPICKERVDDEHQPTVKLQDKGSKSINDISKIRQDGVSTIPGQVVHQVCRRDYTNAKSLLGNRLKVESCTTKSRTLRSEHLFNFQECCILCGKLAKLCQRKRGFDVFSVRTEDFQREILSVCQERNDIWANEVLGRFEFAQDVIAADALYHQQCSVHFRTGKQIPIKASSPCVEKHGKCAGRPKDQDADAAFLRTMKFIEANEEEQLSVSDLVNKMSEFCSNEPYSVVYMKKRVQEYFGSCAFISEINGKANVVTLQKTAASILQDFYRRPKTDNPDAEKHHIITTAAKLIKSDTRSSKESKQDYPSASNIKLVEENLEYLTESLHNFLKIVIHADANIKVAAIGQAIMQATRPRTLLAPLQLGLGIQMHHHFGSKFLIDVLNNLGFSSSYSEVQRYECNAAVSQANEANETPIDNSSSFMQFVADNVDHNIRSLDGHGTFHGMGIISASTPGCQTDKIIHRENVTADDLIALAEIDIHFRKIDPKKLSLLKFERLDFIEVKDKSANLHILTSVVWPHRVPTWSAMSQFVHIGDSPGKSSIVFLPMIDMDPNDVSCVYSTLLFVCKEAKRHRTEPVLTFDQPLYWKAMNIIRSEPDNSDQKSIVLRLGGFHTQMSFLGSIGHLMGGSGLTELLETVYASNPVSHMLTGKAVARATRGHFLVHTALSVLIMSEVYNIQVSEDPRTLENPEQEMGLEDTCLQEACNTNTAPMASGESEQSDISKAVVLYDKLMSGDVTLEALASDPGICKIFQNLKAFEESRIEHRTAKLWIQYMEMVEIIRRFITAERTGNWALHLQTVGEMLPFFAATGHNLYVKSAYIYLQQMLNLESDHPRIFELFQSGYHVIRRSERFWAGLSTDLVIEQVLMRSIKSTGGLTRGRGMTEGQRAKWILSMPQCSEINDAMQQVTCTDYSTSDQHKESGHSRKARDGKDIKAFVDFLQDRSPFVDDPSLRNIETGVTGDKHVNAENAKELGRDIVKSLEGQEIDNYVFKRNKQVVVLSTKFNLKVNGEDVHVDPQLLFQRLVAAANGLCPDISEVFSYELSSCPSSIFEPSGFMRPAKKSQLADAVWNTGDSRIARTKF